MRTLLVLLAIGAALSLGAQIAAAGPVGGSTFITDTLGGNRNAAAVPAQGYRFVTDTLGGNRHVVAAPSQGYRFITDTLGGNGRPLATVLYRGAGFSWHDAAAGGATVAGAMLLTLGCFLLIARRGITT